MNVLHIASEVTPFSKTGGLGDVAGALPRALMNPHPPRSIEGGQAPHPPMWIQGGQAPPSVKSHVVSARYGSVRPHDHGLAKRLRKIPVPVGAQIFEVEVWEGRLSGQEGVPIYLIEHPLFGERDGIYGPQPDQEYPDNLLRFALLCRAALCVCNEFGLSPDLLHAHDWQTALSLYYARAGVHPGLSGVATVLTIHNLSFLGLFPLGEMLGVGVREEHLHPGAMEFYGQASLLKGGLLFADRITTVSPRYAREIQTEEFGHGMHGLLHTLSGRLVGILNGADYDRWSPHLDPYIACHYGSKDMAKVDMEAFAESIAGKARCKAELQRELGLFVRPQSPLCATISRLTPQKGIDLIIEVLRTEEAWRGDMQYLVLGSGERWLEDELRLLQARHPGRMAVHIGYDEPLSHRTEAGADIYIMPSRFEPCGLNQLYSMRYGTIPVVRAVGGLDDSVVDYDPRSRSGTGFKFVHYDPRSLAHAWQRAILAHQGDEEAWLGLQRRAMRVDFSWSASALAYLNVYKQAIKAAAQRY